MFVQLIGTAQGMSRRSNRMVHAIVEVFRLDHPATYLNDANILGNLAWVCRRCAAILAALFLHKEQTFQGVFPGVNRPCEFSTMVEL